MSEWIGGCVLACIEMIEDENGLYRQGEMEAFCDEMGRDATSDGILLTDEESISAWTAWMSKHGYDVYALPATGRTRAWGCGPLFSVTPMSGSENRVYALAFNFA